MLPNGVLVGLPTNALADHIEAVGVAAFIDEWLTNSLFAGLTDETAQRADRLRKHGSRLVIESSARWHWHPGAIVESAC